MTTVSIQWQQAPVGYSSGDPNLTLYQNLYAEGITLRKACDNGVCGVCRCRLTSGAIDYRGRHPYGLNSGLQADGWILPCIAYPKTHLKLSDLRIEEDS
jgi:ferredoxin